jgi:hypothetical protein
MRLHVSIFVLATGIATAAGAAAQHGDKAPIQRGAAAVRGQPAMNPPVWTAKAYDNLWKVWGLKEKPAHYQRAVAQRYGLHPAPYDNGGLPMGLHYSQGLLGKGIVNDCLLCHAGVVAGQPVIGAGNASLDLQSLFDDLAEADKLPYKFPFRFAHVRGTIDPVNPVVFLMEFRDHDLNVRDPIQLDYTQNVNSDPPAWWLLKRKQTRQWTGGVSVNAMRVDMANLLSPFNTAEHIKKYESTFADIHAFVLTVRAPKYPFPIDGPRAEQGRAVFNEHCARCHGTYGAGGKYPNKIVPHATIGTDRTLADSLTAKNLDFLNKTWLAKEKAPDGSFYTVVETPGYQAPRGDRVLEDALVNVRDARRAAHAAQRSKRGAPCAKDSALCRGRPTLTPLRCVRVSERARLGLLWRTSHAPAADRTSSAGLCHDRTRRHVCLRLHGP